MSIYGEDGDQPYTYKKEDMYYELREFLKCHKLYELMSIISDVLEYEVEDDE